MFKPRESWPQHPITDMWLAAEAAAQLNTEKCGCWDRTKDVIRHLGNLTGQLEE